MPLSPLYLGEELSRSFLGALLAVARADGIVNRAELSELARLAKELGITLDNEALFFSDVGPDDLLAAIEGADFDPYRGAGGVEPGVVKHAFLDAAVRIAVADGIFHESERELIARFAEALHLPPPTDDADLLN